MFEKILSSIGIGSAKVNTVLLENNIERGKETLGEVHIFGGIADQKISEIYIHIDSAFHKEDDDTTDFRNVVESILEIKITDPVIVKAHEEKVIPFSFVLPYYTPVTFGNQKVAIKTEIDINFINHPVENHDFVVYDQMVNTILSFLSDRGFKHSKKSGLCRHKQYGDNNPTHCLQAFILGNDQGKKIYFVGNEKDIQIYIYEEDQVRHCTVNREEDVKEQLVKLDLKNN
jgi:sporulation-control protein spo0M